MYLFHRKVLPLVALALLFPFSSAKGQPGLISSRDTLYARPGATLKKTAQPSSVVFGKLDFGDTFVVRDVKLVDDTSR